MYWRYVDNNGVRSPIAYWTQVQAQDNAVLKGARITQAEYTRMNEGKQQVLWKLLERSGWSIRFAP